MNLIKPKKLQKGDTIGLLSVSGDIRSVKNIENASKYFQSLGYQTVISDTTYRKFRYHSGSDEERVKNLEEFFADDKIDAIVCTRGGYGVIRILDKINYDIIKNNPKILCGYSDITALLLYLYKKTGMVCFHGAMANGDFGGEKISKFTEKSFFETLSCSETLHFCGNGKVFNKGYANGILWGGNLATIASMAGLDFIPDEKFILFLEDVNEPAYKIDRMFTQLINIEKFRENIAGLAIGVFSDLEKKNFVDDMFKEYAKALQIPCCDGFLISHEEDKFTLPIGVNCNFSAEKKIIETTEKTFAN